MSIVLVFLFIYINCFDINGLIRFLFGSSSKYLVISDKLGKFSTVYYNTALILLNILCLVVYILRYSIVSFIKLSFKTICSSLKNLFNSLNLVDYFLLLIPLIYAVYLSLNIGVSYDEAVTYNLFISKPFYYCMIFYPYPNNHILYSLVANLTDSIPFIPTLFSIRLPSILASFLLNTLILSFCKKYYSRSSAYLILGVSAGLYISIYYSFMARGYSFLILFTFICFYAAYSIIKNGAQLKYWLIFVISAVLGCYTIPSFLYPLMTLNLMIFILRPHLIKSIVLYSMIIGVISFLCYAPIILVDGVDTLINNQFVKPIARVDVVKILPKYLYETYCQILNEKTWGFVLIFLSLSIMIIKKDFFHLKFFLVFFLSPFILLFFHSVIPFYRTFYYYAFFIPFFIIIPFDKYIKRINSFYVVFCVCLFQIYIFYNVEIKIKEKEGFNTSANLLTIKYYSDKNTILFPCIISENFLFEAKVRKLDSNIYFKYAREVSVDTLSGFDYVIITEESDRTVDLVPVDIISFYKVYKLK